VELQRAPCIHDHLGVAYCVSYSLGPYQSPGTLGGFSFAGVVCSRDVLDVDCGSKATCAAQPHSPSYRVSVPPATIRDQTRTWLTRLPKFLTSLTWFFAVHALGLAALMACGLLMSAKPPLPMNLEKSWLELRHTL
jgi:hypothetical protein